jgi:hypothetical protein
MTALPCARRLGGCFPLVSGLASRFPAASRPAGWRIRSSFAPRNEYRSLPPCSLSKWHSPPKKVMHFYMGRAAQGALPEAGGAASIPIGRQMV